MLLVKGIKLPAGEDESKLQQLLEKKLKGRTSHHLQLEFPVLRKQYWGRHFWAIGYGVWSSGVVSDKMVQDYLEHHRDTPNSDGESWILEE